MNKKNYYAELDWRDGLPFSRTFDDLYFSKASGINESKYVFIEHNQLETRFKQLKNKAKFTIIETGFGSGLNFLATLSLWRKSCNLDCKLHFFSIEKYPLKPQDLNKILQLFPELKNESTELIEQYYLLLPAYHRFSFSGNVELTVIIGDINQKLAELSCSVDAWFLDGFSPAKNTEMWDLEVFNQIARLSHKGTTYATFTASSLVQKNLKAVNFSVIKDKGFANKREMLYGEYNGSSLQHHTDSKPWFSTTIINQYHNSLKMPKIGIIGAGISGASTAHSLAKRGYKVIVFERNHSVAMEASGNYQGMLYGSWSAFDSETIELSNSGYRYSHYLISKLLKKDYDYQQSGLIQIAHNIQQQKRQQQLIDSNLPIDFIKFIDSKEINELCSYSVNANNGGLFFPYGLWLNPPRLVKKLLSHPNIEVVTGYEIDDIGFEDGLWNLSCHNQIVAKTEYLVVANAYAANKFEQLKQLPLRKIRGQISICEQNFSLKTILCGNGYITPSWNGKCTIGATFKFDSNDLTPRVEEHRENIEQLSSMLPDIAKDIDINYLTAQVNYRTSTHDYLPLVGPIADIDKICDSYALLRKDSNIKFVNKCPNYPNLYLNLAHGAKGILTAPISGEIVADYIDGTPPPCSRRLQEALHPNRFYIRDLIRNRL